MVYLNLQNRDSDLNIQDQNKKCVNLELLNFRSISHVKIKQDIIEIIE